MGEDSHYLEAVALEGFAISGHIGLTPGSLCLCHSSHACDFLMLRIPETGLITFLVVSVCRGATYFTKEASWRAGRGT